MEKKLTAISTDFFTRADMEWILTAGADADLKTSGEIAIMVLPESDRYREAEQLGALLVAGLVAVVLCILIHHVTIWTFIPLVCLLYFAAFWLLRRFPRLKISFAGPGRQAEAVRSRALIGFYENGLYRTQGETGILVFISLLEHKVWILGDRGINEKIPPGFWDRAASELAAGIKGGKGADALCAVIEGCGEELARHFPRRHDDINELPNVILTS